MKISKKAVWDLFWSMVPQVSGFAAGFLTSILLARGLGASGLGQYALVAGYYGLIAGISDLGVGQVAIRYASMYFSQGLIDKQFSVLRWAFRVRLTLVATFTLLAFALVPPLFNSVWKAPELKNFAYLGLMIGFFQAFSTIPNVYFQSVKKFKVNAIVTSCQSFLNLLGVAVLAGLSLWGLDKILLINALTAGIGAMIFIVVMPRHSLFKFISEYSSFKSCFLPPERDAQDGSQKTLHFARDLLIASVVVTLTTRADVLLMGAYVSSEQMGIYNVATRFTLPLLFGLGALNTALWPRSSALTDLNDIRIFFGKIWKLILVASGGALLYSLLAPMFAPYVFGEEYSDTVLLSQLLCLRYCISILACPVGIVGYSFGMSSLYWKVNLIQFFVVICVNFIFLPIVGIYASVFALLLNEIIGITFILKCVKNELRV